MHSATIKMTDSLFKIVVTKYWILLSFWDARQCSLVYAASIFRVWLNIVTHQMTAVIIVTTVSWKHIAAEGIYIVKLSKQRNCCGEWHEVWTCCTTNHYKQTVYVCVCVCVRACVCVCFYIYIYIYIVYWQHAPLLSNITCLSFLLENT